MTNKPAKFLGLILLLMLVVNYFYTRSNKVFQVAKPTDCSPYSHKFSKTTGKIDAPEPFQITYAFLIQTENSKNFDLLTTELPGHFWSISRSQHPRLRYIKNLGNGRFKEDLQFPFIQTQHARHILPFLWRNQVGFLLADHGPDQPPFPGGPLRAFLREKGHGWREATQDILPEKTAFHFHATEISSSSFNEQSIFVGVVGDAKKKQGSFLMKKEGQKFEVSNSLPEDLMDGRSCFMTNQAADFNGDGLNEIFLGGCDRPPGTNMMSEDRFLVQDGEIWKYSAKGAFPSRLKDRSWGTVAVAAADLNNDGFLDIVTAIHNFGFTEGALQIYINTGSDLKFSSLEQKILEPAEEGKASFIPWVRLGDLDGDKYPEILAPITPVFQDGKDPNLKKNFVLYKNLHGESFEDITQCLDSNLPYIADAEFLDLNNDGKLDVFLLSSDGRFEIFYSNF